MVSDIFPTSPTYFQIQLQNDSFHSYVAGQTIIGRVVVELKDKLKIMALKIELLGKGVAHWQMEHYAYGARRRFVSMPEEETYIYQAKYLIGERADTPVNLVSGVHSFPYFFTLSPWLPSSFEGRRCHIRYSLRATLERALFKDLKSEPLKFEIKGILDLNQYPAIARPLNVSEHKNGDLFCWKLWSVALNLDIEKTGYIPEEILKFSVTFNNSCSNVKLTHIRAYLVQQVAVRAPTAQNTYEKTILKIKGPLIEAGEVDTWRGQLEVPHVEPTGLGLYPSKVLRFNIQYYLKVAAKNVFSTISRKVSLTIGTIPLRDATTVPPGSSVVGLVAPVTFGNGQQFTPYKNLSEIFPAIVANNPTSNTESGASQENGTNVTDPATNSDGALIILPDTQISALTTSLTTIAENAKTPLKRTDTPPPSYEEAIKKPLTKRS